MFRTSSAAAFKISVPDYIAGLELYSPGKPIEELEREYGFTNAIKLASNENPLGPSPAALDAIREALPRLHRYPDGSGYSLRKRLSEKFQLPFDGIVLSNGSNELIDLAIRTFLLPQDEVVLPVPSFLVYQLAVQTMGGKTLSVPLKDFTIDLPQTAAAVTQHTKIVFINNPNNPTGTLVSKAAFDAFLESIPPHIVVVLDEAYIEFAQDRDTPKGFDYIHRPGPFVIVARTFSKAYGLAGLRIGYGAMAPPLAEYLHRVRQPFNTGLLSQVAALAALDDDSFLERTRQVVTEGLAFLYREMARLRLKTVPTQANFLLVEVPCDARRVYEAMLRQGVIIRPMNAYGMLNTIRVNTGLPEENERFVRSLEETLHQLQASN